MSDGDAAASGEEPEAIHHVDLVLGAWRPREAALQLATGLGIELTQIARTDPDESKLATIAVAIDMAAQGDVLVNQAWDDASRVVDGLVAGAVVVVLAPRFGLPLRADNEWFFFFIRRLGHAVVIVGDEPPMRAIAKSPFERRRSIDTPDREILTDEIGQERMRILRFFPGLIPRTIAESADLTGETLTLIPVGPGHFLIPAGYRDKDPRLSARDLDVFEEIEAADEGLKALAQFFCTGHFAEAGALIELGLRHVRSGSRDLAHDLFTRARAVARNPELVALAELALLHISLCEGRFEDVAAAPTLSPRAPSLYREKMQELKEWERLESGDLSGASNMVTASLKRLGKDGSVDARDIHRLNAVVGARRRSGEIEGALSLGRSVAAALGHAGDSVDQRLIHANAMSLIRIYMARGDAKAFAGEFERAFAPSLGARSAGDILLMNIIRARAEGDPSSETASRCWLRAGLVWLCHEPREGLSRDVVEAVLGIAKVPTRPEVESEMAIALADGLAASWPSVASTEAGPFPNVHLSSAPAAITPQRIYGGPGAAIVWVADTTTMRPPSPPRARLIRFVYAALGEICPLFREIGSGTITIDTNLGADIPDSREAALSVALRSNVAEVAFVEETIKLDAAARARLGGELFVRLSPIVADIVDAGDGLIVTFKLYLPKVTIAGIEARILAFLRNGEPRRLKALTIESGEDPAEIEPILRRLERARIVRVEIPSR